MPDLNHASVYHERQKFNQTWIYLLLIFVDLALFTGFIFQVYFHKSAGMRPMNNMDYVIAILVVNLVIALLFFSVLQTVINEEGISFKFVPFHLKWKMYKWAEIQSVYVRPYQALSEYGGWGLKYGGDGWSYTTSGNTGIQIVLKNGKKILLGTQNPVDSAAILKSKFPS
jgi:hypothetical protein